MMQVIVHAGYHKTGTTSLQAFMANNRTALAPHFDYYGETDFPAASADARTYGQKPFPWRLRNFRASLRGFLSTIPDADIIVLSCESFSGAMPGHRRTGGATITTYFGPSLKLARAIIGALRRRFGRDVEITFFYTTRERDNWISSVHGHLLRSIDLAEDLDTFRAGFPALASPAQEAERMRAALSPVPVITAALEDWGMTPEGPAGALLELIDLPDDIRSELPPAPLLNQGQDPATRDAFRALNAKEMPKPDRKAAKAAMLARKVNTR